MESRKERKSSVRSSDIFDLTLNRYLEQRRRRSKKALADLNLTHSCDLVIIDVIWKLEYYRVNYSREHEKNRRLTTRLGGSNATD